jgi:hypothetical protein
MFKYLALAGVVAANLLEDNCQNIEAGSPQYELICNANRAFSGQIGNTINSMNEYGCWCYFGDDHGRGKGTPVDAIDEMCKVLHEGYECAMRDAEDEGSTCVPWEVAYTSAVGGSGLTIAEECANVNSGNNCAIRACTVEGSFMANLLDVFISGNGINNDNRHSNGFDQATVCATKKNGGGPSNKACCGNYPDRFPFKTVGGDRQCCGSRTYNSLTLKCCDASASQVKFNC